jgi:outer membrane protein OmpA-like peptidoglycan-associated protein
MTRIMADKTMRYFKPSAGARASVMISACVLLSACSQVPDALNPVEWYNSTVSLFSGDEKEKTDGAQAQDGTAKENDLAKDAGKAPPGSDQAFPKLNRVDSQAEYEAARKKSGLVADVEGRQYAPAIARQGEPSSQLAEAPPAPPTPSAGAPSQPAPATPVISSTEMASAPATPVVSGSGLPTTAEQQAFEARLRKQLAEIRARAAQPGPALPQGNATAQLQPDNFGTVVISADGIESGGQAAAMETQTAAAAGTNDLAYLARQPRAVSSGAVRVATIQFANGSAQLSASDRRILVNVRQLHKERGGRVHIVGHASSRTRTMDPVRHKMVNFKVSVDRANTIASELMRMGFKKEQIVVDAVSDTEPVFYEFMPTGEAGNRRAEIYLEG